MSSKHKRTSFNHEWLLKDQFKLWVAPVEHDLFSAKCKLCQKNFTLSNMGEQALRSHMQGKKHEKAVSASHSLSMEVFYQKKNLSEASTKPNDVISGPSLVVIPGENEVQQSVSPPPPSANTSSNVVHHSNPKPRGLETMLKKNNVTKAEILWCLKIVRSRDSQSSGGESVNLFSQMFPDSEIAQKMKLQRTKIAYTINFGLAPYFSRDLQNVCHACDYIVVGFDESLNKIAQKGQMDVFVRFWHSKMNQVCTRYYSSAFLGHATAKDLRESFSEATNGLDLKKLLQVSMDGPNVNLKFIQELKAEQRKANVDGPVLLDLGSCGLHTVHNGYKRAMKKNDWKIMQFLRALYYLFCHSPARREDYIKASGSELFPLKFCAVRWVENFNVAGRALKIIHNVRKYVEYIKTYKEMKEPSCNSFEIVSSALNDRLLSAKISFFQTIASDIESFLTQFQSNNPLALLLYEALSSTMHIIIIKEEVLNSVTNIVDLDFKKSENFKDIKQIDLGFATKNALRHAGVKPIDEMQFRKQCRDSLIEFCSVLSNKSPLKYILTKGISCFDPMIALDCKKRISRLTVALDYFLETRWLTGQQCDRIKKNYKDVCMTPLFDEKMKDFSIYNHRLDDYWLDVIPSHTNFSELRSFLKMVLILSHGNSFVEGGFSVNKEILVENLSNESLIGQRQVYDAIMFYGGIEKIEINNSLIHAARNAHGLYQDALKKKQESANAEAKRKAEKRKASEELKELKKKKKAVLDNARQVADLESEIRKLT